MIFHEVIRSHALGEENRKNFPRQLDEKWVDGLIVQGLWLQGGERRYLKDRNVT